MPTLGMVSTVIPSAFVRGRAGKVDFPSYLGKNSNAGKQKRLLKEVQVHMSPKTSGTDKREIRLDYMPHLLHPLLSPLQTKGQEGIPQVLDTMEAYNLSKVSFLFLDFALLFVLHWFV